MLPGQRFTPRRNDFLRWFVILLIVWCAGGIYEGMHLKQGFVPWDAGAYAQSADRVLKGQLPHRDFVEVYTGGLTYLDAAAMRIFGENLATERLMMFAFFLAWIPALYWIASRFCRDWIAGALVLLAVAWSVPNYSEAVPSWYNLFFATFGVAALLAYLERPAWKWLVLAGTCGGISFLAKSVGLCYVAGALLFFVFHEQMLRVQQCESCASTRREAVERDPRGRLGWYSAFLIAAMAIFLTLLSRMILQLPSSGRVILFIAPSAALCGVLVWNEFQMRVGRGSAERFANLFAMVIPFCAGVILPIVIFIAPYARAHAMGALVHDLFGQAVARIAAANKLPDDTITIIPTIFLGLALATSTRMRKAARWILTAFISALLIYAFTTITQHGSDSYTAVWSTAYWIIPVLTVIGCAALSRLRMRGLNFAAQERIFLLLSVTALCSLVEFPYSAPIYFCYVAPLAILAIAALVSAFQNISRGILAVLYAAFMIFAAAIVTPSFIYAMGFGYAPDTQNVRLNLPRAGGLRVDAEAAAVYGQLIPLIRAHAGDGDIYAGPDSPEVYFLAGYENPTPDIYDFLRHPLGERDEILRLTRDLRIRVMVLNTAPELSAPLAEDLHEKIAQQFPHGEMVGNFEVRWRPNAVR